MNQCANCGEFVTADFVRVFGDDANQVNQCPACESMAEVTGRTSGDRDRGGGWL